MSEIPESAPPPAPPPAVKPPPPPPGAGPYRPLRPPSPPPSNSSFLGCAFALSFALNVLGGLILILLCFGAFVFEKSDTSTTSLTEQHYSGKSGASDKVAIITLDGIILERLTDFVHKQIDQAASDKHVKAVVVRINSPGGSITASDELYHQLMALRDGSTLKKHGAKPLIVSMGAIAASGGYYVAVPGQTLFAEPTTMTGSIGVYSSFPNVKKLANEHGVFLNTIKQGQIKDSGSPFAEMNEHEREVWQDLIDEAYQRFVQVVEKGRPALAGGKLLEPIELTPLQAGPGFLKKDKKAQPYRRYLADGGVWTAEKALKYQLIDKIGTLDDAVQAAHDAANLGENYQAIKYKRPGTLHELLGLDAQSRSLSSGSVLDPARLEAGFRPRLWYLAPGAELSGFFAAARE
jgi:protease-4